MIFTLTEFDATKAKAKGKKNCTKGLACGAGCISKTKKCKQKMGAGGGGFADHITDPSNLEKGAESSLIDLDEIIGDEPTAKTPAKNGKLESPPESKEVLGEGAYGRVFITDQGTAYKETLDGSAISKNEVKLMDEAAKLGVAPELIGTYSEGKQIKGYEMEMLTGHTPVSGLKGGNSSERSETAESLAQSLSILHKNGIVHGDLHSENAMVKDGKTKLIDYGLSSRISDENPTRPQLERWKEEVSGYNRILNWELKSKGGETALIYSDTNKALLKANDLESLKNVYKEFRSKL
jgi:predicted Ser/Thr protein kinase